MERDKLEKLLTADDDQFKRKAVEEFLQGTGKYRDYLFIHKLLHDRKAFTGRPVSIAVLSSFTLDQIRPLLEVHGYLQGFAVTTYIGGFNQYEQEILQPQSALYGSAPRIILLCVRLEELFPAFFSDFAALTQEEIDGKRVEIVKQIFSLMRVVRKNCEAKVLVSNFVPPPFLAGGLYDRQSPNGQTSWVDSLNRQLTEELQQLSDVFVFDLHHLLLQHGMQEALDDKMWFSARCPFNTRFLTGLARKISVYMSTLESKPRKCLVLDLDNTLWGGVVGEDGFHGIAIGSEYPGNVFQEIQRTIRQYASRGVILAVNSKNNMADVTEVFERHPDMVLQWDDFSAVRVNWQNKAQNMQELATELNIGLDSFVFIDDNPAEIEMVHQTFPEIETVSFSHNPLENLRKVRELACFEKLSITESDRKKGQQYREQAQRHQLKSTVANLEDFYRSLNMEVEITKGDEFALKRLVQLTQKTNQFNLTTRRYGENDLQEFITSESYRVYYLRLRDRFGDNGITGLSIIKIDRDCWIFDTFLMSCRIIGRTVETGLLAFIVEQAEKENVRKLIGEYIPTPKNSQVKDFYLQHGFCRFSEGKEGFWQLEVAQAAIEWPEWLKRK